MVVHNGPRRHRKPKSWVADAIPQLLVTNSAVLFPYLVTNLAEKALFAVLVSARPSKATHVRIYPTSINCSIEIEC